MIINMLMMLDYIRSGATRPHIYHVAYNFWSDVIPHTHSFIALQLLATGDLNTFTQIRAPNASRKYVVREDTSAVLLSITSKLAQDLLTIYTTDNGAHWNDLHHGKRNRLTQGSTVSN